MRKKLAMTAIAGATAIGSMFAFSAPASAYPVPYRLYDVYAQCQSDGVTGAWYGYWSTWYCDANPGDGPFYVLMVELANG